MQGLLNLSPWGVVAYGSIVTHITIAAVTIFLHRYQAHRALELHPAVSHFFRFWLWLTTGMVTREWVAIHRKHHAACETEDDPHSPQVRGLRKVLLEGAELYREASRNRETLDRYGRGTPDDWLERQVYTGRRNRGVSIMLLLNLLLLGPIGLSIWAIQMLWIPLWAAGVINGVGHALGYRNFQSPDASTNIVPWGILIGGEELHNNHHAYPASAKLSSRWWEFDIGWFYIRALEIVRLARVKRVAPKPARVVAAPGRLDGEAVRAIVNSRFQVLARYGREVMARVHREETRRLAAIDRGLKARFKPARRLLLREERLLDDDARRRLEDALAYSQALQTVYQYRRQLQAIWQSAAGPEAARKALQEWCRRAEATGIDALQHFARRLGGYRLRET